MKNPFLNALAAAAYIALGVLTVSTLSPFAPAKDSIIAPMIFLGTFVLSAAVMSFLFLAQPLQIYFDNRRQEAVTFFLKTVLTFALFVLTAVLSLLFLQ